MTATFLGKTSGVNQRTVWLWVSKNRLPAKGQGSLVLACVTPSHLTLPDACCACGTKTSSRFPLKIRPPRSEQRMRLLAGLGGPTLHLAMAVRELADKRLPVPCCRDCRLIHRLGLLLGLVGLFAGLGLLFGPMFVDHERLIRMPVAAALLPVLGGLLLIIVGRLASEWITRVAVPVDIYRREDRCLYYEFRSRRFQERLLSSSNCSPQPYSESSVL
jgi:hypothetical protein